MTRWLRNTYKLKQFIQNSLFVRRVVPCIQKFRKTNEC